MRELIGKPLQIELECEMLEFRNPYMTSVRDSNSGKIGERRVLSPLHPMGFHLQSKGALNRFNQIRNALCLIFLCSLLQAPNASIF